MSVCQAQEGVSCCKVSKIIGDAYAYENEFHLRCQSWGVAVALTFQFSCKGIHFRSQNLSLFFSPLQSLLILSLSDERQKLLQPLHWLTCSVGTIGLAAKAFPANLWQVQWLKQVLKVVIPLFFTLGKVQLDYHVEFEPPQYTEGVDMVDWVQQRATKVVRG